MKFYCKQPGGLSPMQIQQVQDSWRRVKRIDPVLIGDVFYSKLFTDAPQVKQLFHSPRLDQACKLITSLSLIVHQLDQTGGLTKSLQLLALRHVRYGIRPEHYALAAEPLFWTLETLLGEHWNEEVEEAWRKAYEVISVSMINAVLLSETLSASRN